MKNNKWRDVYQLRDMINHLKAIIRNSCDEDEVDICTEMIHDYENRIQELIGV